MNAQELYVKKECGEFKPSTIFFCEKCRAVYRDKARADECCGPKKEPDPLPCTYCGELVPVNGCSFAPHFHDECRTADWLSKAEEIPAPFDEDAMVCDSHRDQIDTIEMIMDYYYAEETPKEYRPEYCFACTPRTFAIDSTRVVNNLLEDFWCPDSDYPQIEQVVDLKELEDFVTQWNSKQTIVTYSPDYTKKIRLEWDETMFEENETGLET